MQQAISGSSAATFKLMEPHLLNAGIKVFLFKMDAEPSEYLPIALPLNLLLPYSIWELEIFKSKQKAPFAGFADMLSVRSYVSPKDIKIRSHRDLC